MKFQESGGVVRSSTVCYNWLAQNGEFRVLSCMEQEPVLLTILQHSVRVLEIDPNERVPINQPTTGEI